MFGSFIRTDRAKRGSAISFLTLASVTLPDSFFDFLLGTRSWRDEAKIEFLHSWGHN
jgi:hypothetical protein